MDSRSREYSRNSINIQAEMIQRVRVFQASKSAIVCVPSLQSVCMDVEGRGASRHVPEATKQPNDPTVYKRTTKLKNKNICEL